jgi:hypothetical protein
VNLKQAFIRTRQAFAAYPRGSLVHLPYHHGVERTSDFEEETWPFKEYVSIAGDVVWFNVPHLPVEVVLKEIDHYIRMVETDTFTTEALNVFALLILVNIEQQPSLN